MVISRPSWLRLGAQHLSPVVLALYGLIMIGLVLRLVWVLYADTIPLGGDPGWYYDVAWNLANGNGYVADHLLFTDHPIIGQPTAFWPPAYSFTLAGFWKVLGVEAPSQTAIDAAKLFNALLSALTIPFVFGLGRQLFNERVGLGAAGLFAVFPNGIAWLPVLFTEALFILLVVVALWLLVSFPPASRRRWLPVACFGALVGLALLTRGQGAVLVPVAVLYWWMCAGRGAALRSTALALAVAALVIMPWTVRNWLVMDAFIPISTNSGAALRVGHAPDAIGTTRWTNDVIDGFRMDESVRHPEWEVKGYREYTRRAISYAFTHPGHEIELTGSKLYYLYRSDAPDIINWVTTRHGTPLHSAELERTLQRTFDYAYYVLLFGAAASVPFWLRWEARRVLPASFFLAWALFHVIFLGEPRYHVPLYPILSIAVAAGVWQALTLARRLLERWRAHRFAPLQVASEEA